MAEHVEKIVEIEENEMVIEEKPGIGARIVGALSNAGNAVKKHGKEIAAATCGAAALAAAGFGIATWRERQRYLRDNGLTIEDVEGDPELKAHYEAEFGPLPEEEA